MFPNPYDFIGEFDQIFKVEIETILHNALRRKHVVFHF